jgi:hypothetical protein
MLHPMAGSSSCRKEVHDGQVPRLWIQPARSGDTRERDLLQSGPFSTRRAKVGAPSRPIASVSLAQTRTW